MTHSLCLPWSRNASYLCHTIIPKLDKYSSANQLGMYPSSISIDILFVRLDCLLVVRRKKFRVNFKTWFHSPDPMLRRDGKPFLISHSGPTKATELIERSISIKPILPKLRKKEDVTQQAENLHVRSTGTVVELRLNC